MSIIKWSPFNELDAIQEQMNKLFEGSKKQSSSDFGSWIPSADISEDDNNYQIMVDLPGIPKDKIDISVSGNTLTLRAERKEKKETKQNYYRAERAVGFFERQFTFNHDIDDSKVTASYKDGVLEIKLPKQKQDKSKLIKIQ